MSLYMIAPDQPRGFKGLVWDLQEWLWRATRVPALRRPAFDAMAMISLVTGAASSYLLLALALLQHPDDAADSCGIKPGAQWVPNAPQQQTAACACTCTLRVHLGHRR